MLQDFPSCRPSLERLLALCPRIRPRAFSIASSPHPLGPHPAQMHLCVAVVRFRTPYRRYVVCLFMCVCVCVCVCVRVCVCIAFVNARAGCASLRACVRYQTKEWVFLPVSKHVSLTRR